MKVIFVEDDRVAEVSEGYARNYLLPRKLVIKASPHALALVAKREAKKKTEVDKKRVAMNELAEKLAASTVTVTADVGEGGKLFGSVTAADIAGAVKRELGIELDRKKLDLREPLKVVGEYSVPVKLFQDITGTIKLNVAAR
ncbi:MAG: 50S ribosomal protein L9 [Candidatus Margulisbacteria bacterium]|jgi:large subunit ribosomal protein L9|nr:50S ribosomal protein L9 [Candidatus Margulisiibacteriota bacterium]